MAKERMRLDQLLVTTEQFSSRTQAQRAVMAGEVWVDGVRADKAGQATAVDAQLRVQARRQDYVSRGGYKLLAALQHWAVDPTGQVALDSGASTGGFTDCLLQHGARCVYAVDVGYGQLDWKLRCDERVVVKERLHIRDVEPAHWERGVPTLATIDLSFIAAAPLLPHLRRLLAPGATLLLLVKPQFEAKRQEVGKHGVVREVSVHRRVLLQVAEAALAAGWDPLDCMPSPLLGPKGNREFFWQMCSQTAPERDWAGMVERALVAAAELES